MTGRMVSHYRILEQLGGGGMGVVYKAEDTRLGRTVALKFLAKSGADAAALDRFQREARTASSLNHPNICTIHDVGEHEGEPFFVMELLAGETLAERIGRPFPAAMLLDLALQIADALDAAHSSGIVHRDIKPANLAINARNQIKVLDFGLAKFAAASRPAAIGATATIANDLLTSPGTTLGTVAYMSPEQARGEELDGRSDLFSLGVVLYEMATGRQPFRGATAALTFEALLNRDPDPPSHINPALPAEADRVILRLLEKDPELRYQTAADLRSELKLLRRVTDTGRVPISASSSVKAVPVSTRARAPWWIGAAAVGVIGAACGGYLYLRPAAPKARGDIQLTQITHSGKIGASSLSPDGKYVAYVDDRDLRLRQIATGSDVKIGVSEGQRYQGMRFSPNGNYLYYTAGEGRSRNASLWQVPVLGGTARKIVENLNGAVTFSPDGKRIAFIYIDFAGKVTHLKIASEDGSGEKILASRGSDIRINQPSWSPDGSLIAVPASDRILFFAPDGSGERTLRLAGWNAFQGLSWAPDAKSFYVAAEEETVEVSRHQILEVSYPEGKVRRVTNDLSDYHGLQITADGSTLGATPGEGSGGIWIFPSVGSKQGKRVPGGRADGSNGLFWTRDGRLVASDIQGRMWIMNQDGSGRAPLTSGASFGRMMKPCGEKRVVYTARSKDSRPQVWIAGIEGGSARQLTLEKRQAWPSCSEDGTWVYFNEDNAMFRIPAEGGKPEKLLDNYHDYAMSPDGKWIAVHADNFSAGIESLQILPAAGGAPVKSLTGLLGGQKWSADSKSLYFSRREQQYASNLYNLPVGAGEPRPVTDFDANQVAGFDISPDGKLAISRMDFSSDLVLITNFR